MSKVQKEDNIYTYYAPSHRYMHDLNISLYEYSGMTVVFLYNTTRTIYS